MKANLNKSAITATYWSLIISLIITGCGNSANEADTTLSTATSGKVKIAVDESLTPIIDAEIEAFEGLYTRAEIAVEYTSEATAVNQLMQDSVKLAVLTRTLTPEELEIVQAEKIYPTKVQIAIGAISLITNNANADTTLTMNEVREIFEGKVTQWRQLDTNSSLGDIQIVFSNQNASTVRFIKDSIAGGALPTNSYALTSNTEIIDYISQHPNTLGILGVSWISDRDSPEILGFLNQIQVVAIAGDTGDGEFYKPYQAYIANGSYPLTRNIYIISREARTGLGSGFMSFVAGVKGQRVVLKSGLVPASMPVRILQFTDE